MRHRIFQARFKGVQRAIVEKAKEYGVPIIFVNPKNTSRTCPVHGSIIKYDKLRIGKCPIGNEVWHRDVVACWNILFKAYLGDGSDAPSSSRLKLDGSLVPLGSTVTHDPIRIKMSLWMRWKSLLQIQDEAVGTNGPKEKSKEVIELLRHTANNVLYIGENGAGLYMKLVNNLIASAYMAAIAEAYSLGIKAGLDVNKISEFLSNYSIVSSPLTRLKYEKIAKGDYSPQFKLRLMTKDLRIINQVCEELGVTNFISSITLKLHEMALKYDLGELDMSAIKLLCDKL